jgi:Transposase
MTADPPCGFESFCPQTVVPLIAEDRGRLSGVRRDFRTGSNRIFTGKNEIGCQGRKRGIFSAEFKEEAARMVVETSRSIARVARELRVNETTLGSGLLTLSLTDGVLRGCWPGSFSFPGMPLRTVTPRAVKIDGRTLCKAGISASQ